MVARLGHTDRNRVGKRLTACDTHQRPRGGVVATDDTHLYQQKSALHSEGASWQIQGLLALGRYSRPKFIPVHPVWPRADV